MDISHKLADNIEPIDKENTIDTVSTDDASEKAVNEMEQNDSLDDFHEDVSADVSEDTDVCNEHDSIQEDVDAFDNEEFAEQDNTDDSIQEDEDETEDTDIYRAKLIKDLVDQNVTKAHLPQNGEWSNPSAKGNSDFIISDDAVITWGKGDNDHCSGAELKQWMREKYSTDSVRYDHKEPDFTPFIDKNIGQIRLDKMPTKRIGGSYLQAEETAMSELGFESKTAVRNYMKKEGLTWHECADGHTVIAIPTRVNAAFKHTGGISVERSIISIRETISAQTGGASLSLQRKSLGGMAEGIGQAIEAQHKNFKKTKRTLFGK